MQKTQKTAVRFLAGVTVAALVLGTVASLGGFFTAPSSDSDGAFPPYAVHWDFPLEITVCGQDYAFTQKEDETRVTHGHNDGYIHVEGTVTNSEDATIGAFFESVGLDFGNDHIAEYKSGETVCPEATTPGILTVKANDTVLEDPMNYVLNKQHQDIIITFE